MTFLTLARRNAWRKPMRTLLLIFCIAVAFLIYGLTASFLSGTQGSAGANDDVLGVMNKSGRDQTLPIAYLRRIASVEGVAEVTYMSRLRGFSEVERNVVVANAVSPEDLARINGTSLGLTPDLLAALKQGRDRVLVGRALADAQGWQAGQRIEVTSFNIMQEGGNRNWRFEVGGIFEGASASTDTYFMLANYEYVNALRIRNVDTVDGFVVQPDPDVSASVLASRIDAEFANTGAPTRTQTEKQFLEAFLRQFADVELIVSLVVGAAFVTILMIVINTMLFAVRERTFEIGVLKTLGFKNGFIVLLILCETLLIFLVGGAIGIALTKLATQVAGPALGLVLTGAVLGKSLVITVLLGLVTGLLPSVLAMRTTVSNAFKAR
ncbi:ABC transporter permease [Phaeobacter gallaeciensis]|uniref:ABC-type transport system, involved in lipoprotein release, permease component n=1 Tax=Phaeobacter gallaeciensis TaxID=60890 RepID=A0AAC9Z9S8_9RHOB|nr:FtsX-like permease family protein [Phaeobacter gallaeciensis]AHD09794.1 ABC-type transport system, involved in lipoprotein release, permease component [Phaeobacter gallaeciensis DSM 26640]ATE93058.1 ABC-type transport system, involved in lipoprotein release, permease component [Phaeobacter gallaeciensis]ATE97120.1 ABC-type transport system, involved in lipoprotein release, permease component [Phaeobacter gallaeciensis]ATF01723.1 ABC-type transport system, involved in lipoprotein release, per